VSIGGKGSIIKIRWAVVSGPKNLRFLLNKVFVQIDDVTIKIRQAKHDVLLPMMTSLFSGTIKRRIERKIAEGIFAAMDAFNQTLNETVEHAVETQRYLKQKSTLPSTGTEAASTVRQTVPPVKDQIGDVLDAASKAGQKIRENMKDVTKQAKEKVSDITDKVKDTAKKVLDKPESDVSGLDKNQQRSDVSAGSGLDRNRQNNKNNLGQGDLIDLGRDDAFSNLTNLQNTPPGLGGVYSLGGISATKPSLGSDDGVIPSTYDPNIGVNLGGPGDRPSLFNDVDQPSLFNDVPSSSLGSIDTLGARDPLGYPDPLAYRPLPATPQQTGLGGPAHPLQPVPGISDKIQLQSQLPSQRMPPSQSE